MRLGMIGLGKMGGNMLLRLAKGSPDGSIAGGHEIVGYDRSPRTDLATTPGVTITASVDELLAQLPAPRVVWLMVPAGNPTESLVHEMSQKLQAGDTLIDGGNSYFKDSVRRSEHLAEKKINFLDVGTSGGIWGLKEGYCMMIGGVEAAVKHCAPIFDTLAPRDGWAHVGAPGAGHFVKMIHNGIEYGIMEAYGEGFEIMRKSKFELNLHQISAVWNRGSVVRSWLLELAEEMLRDDPTLRRIQPYVEDSGEGRWTLQAAIEEAVPAPVIAASLFARFESRDTEENFSARFSAALRKQFGGHDVNTKDVVRKSDTHKVE